MTMVAESTMMVWMMISAISGIAVGLSVSLILYKA